MNSKITNRILLTMLATLLFQGCYISPEGKAKIEELQKLAGETELYPDFKQVDYSHVSKPERTVIAYFYKSSASYDQVKDFYVRTLSAKGWKFGPEEQMQVWLEQKGNRLAFQKGQYKIHVEYADSPTGEYQYAVDYGWTRKD